jgi:hypothetical protein
VLLSQEELRGVPLESFPNWKKSAFPITYLADQQRVLIEQ